MEYFEVTGLLGEGAFGKVFKVFVHNTSLYQLYYN